MSEQSSRNRPTVLVVDDDAVDREIVRRLVGDEFIVAEAPDVASGLQRLQSQPDLVLLDHCLGGESGADAVPAFVAQGATVIVFTGLDGPVARDRARARGAHSFVSKNDLSRETLLTTLRQVMREVASR